MASPTTGLLATISASLDDHGTAWTPVDDTRLAFRIQWEAASYDFLACADDDTGIVTCRATIGVRIPDARRTAVAEAAARINMQTGVGHFDLDFDDGTLAWRATIDVEGGLFAQAMFDSMVHAALWSCETWLGAFMAVAFGHVEPVVAVAAVTATDDAAGAGE